MHTYVETLERVAVASARCHSEPLLVPVEVGAWSVLAWYPVAVVDEELRARGGQFMDGAVVRLLPESDRAVEVLVWIRHDGTLGSFTVQATDIKPLSVRVTHEGVKIGEAELVAKEWLEGLKPPVDLEAEQRRSEQIAELERFRPRMEPGGDLERQLDREIERITSGGGSGLATFETPHEQRLAGRPRDQAEILKVAVALADECKKNRQGAYARTAVRTNYAVSTVYGYARRAQKEGILSPTVKGKGGRVLTARGRALLTTGGQNSA